MHLGTTFWLLAPLAALFALTGGASAGGMDPTGVWMNDTGRGAIEIKDCAGKLCGHLVWIKEASKAKGCGIQIIGDAAPVGPDKWDNGWIYDPENKAKFDVELTTLADGTLRVKGYAGTKLFSRTMIWTRAPADLARCAETNAAAPAGKPPAEARTEEPSRAAAAPEAAEPDAMQPAPKANPKITETDKNAETGDEPKPRKKSEAKASAKESAKVARGEARDYGPLHRSASGNCTLNVASVTVKFPCKDDGDDDDDDDEDD